MRKICQRIALALTVALFAGAVLVGCSPQNGGEEKSGVTKARAVNDGQKAAIAHQSSCPVCGKGIKADYYADMADGRVYFDKQECVDKFKRNPREYMRR